MPRGDVGRNVFAAMERANMRPSDLVRLSNQQGHPISFARITNWKTGENDPHTDLLPFLAKTLNTTLSELLGEPSLTPHRANAEGDVKIPRLSPIRAGSVWTDPFDQEDTWPVPSFMVDEFAFCCEVEGDSMIELLYPGDIAVFHRQKMPNLGNVVVARNDKGELTIKQFKHDGEQYILVPLNENYPTMEADSWQIEGTLTGYIRSVGDELQIRHHPRGLRP